MNGERSLYITAADGIRLAVRVSGVPGATPVLLLHGVSSSSLTYDWLPPSVLEGFEIYKLDFRGHGASGHAPGTYSHPTYFDDTVLVLEKLIKRPAIVAGFSLGGMVGWTLAQRRPDLVKAVLLEEPVLFPEDVYTGIIPEILRHTIEQEIDWQRRGIDGDTAAFELGLNPAGPGRTLSDFVHGDSLKGLAISTLVRDRGVTEAAIDGTMVLDIDVSDPVQVPTIILAGGEQFGSVFHNTHGDVLGKTHPEVEIIRFDDAAHDIHNSFAGRDLYADILHRFALTHGG